MTSDKSIEFKTSGNGKKGKANAIDSHVGQQVRRFRSIACLSQNQLAEKIGVTFQQLQKYENGSNRISAARLYDLGKALNTPISAFFENYEEDGVKDTGAENHNLDSLYSKETMNLLQIFYTIENASLRKNLLNFTKELAKTLNDESTKNISSDKKFAAKG